MEKGRNPFDSPIFRINLQRKKILISSLCNIYFCNDVRNKNPFYIFHESCSALLSSLPFLHSYFLSSLLFYSFLIFFFSQRRCCDGYLFSNGHASCQGCINNNAPHPCIGIVAPIAQHSNTVTIVINR